MPTPRAAAMAGVLCDRIVVFGGFNGFSDVGVTEIYDPRVTFVMDDEPLYEVSTQTLSTRRNRWPPTVRVCDCCSRLA